MIYVAVVTYNRIEKVQACIRSILPMVEKHGARLVVLDNGSKDGTALWLALLASRMERFTYWPSFQNVGPGGGRQRIVDRLIGGGLQWGDTLIFLDSDVQAKPHEDWIEGLMKPLQDVSIGVSSAYGRNINREWTGFDVPLRLPNRVDVTGGGMTAIKGAVFLQGVEFDQQFAPFWHEDADLCLQVRAAGFEVHCVGEAESVGLWHEAEHKEADEAFERNLRKLKEKWAGKKLIRAERVPVMLTVADVPTNMS